MADGIKIRALQITNTVKKSDVLIIDKLNTITNENITYQINLNDFATGLFTNNDLHTIENLYNVSIVNPQMGDVLYHNGVNWTNKSHEEIVFDNFTVPLRTATSRIDTLESKVQQLEIMTTEEKLAALEAKVTELQDHLSRLIEIE